MGLYIALGIIFTLFIAAAFIAARLEDELQKERNLVKNLLNDITYLKAQIRQRDDMRTMVKQKGEFKKESETNCPNFDEAQGTSFKRK